MPAWTTRTRSRWPAADGQQVIDRIAHVQEIAGTREHTVLITACLARLTVFRVSRQIAALYHILQNLAEGES